MVWDGKLVVWGGLVCFGVVWGVSTDPLLKIQNSPSQSWLGTFNEKFDNLMKDQRR